MKRNIRSKFAKSIFFPLFIIFILLIAIIILTVTNTVGQDVRKSVIAEKQEQLSFVENNISKRISELRRVFFHISEDTNFYTVDIPDFGDMERSMVANLNRYIGGNEFASYLVYYQLSNPDKLYSSTGAMSPGTFIRATINGDSAKEDEMMDKIRRTVGTQYHTMIFDTDSSAYLMIVNSYPYFSQKPKAFAIAFVPNNALQEIADVLFMDCRGEFLIMSTDRTVIYQQSNGLNESLYDQISAEYFNSESGTGQTIEISGQKYLAQEIYNAELGWHYVSLLRASDLMEEVNRRHTMLYVFIATLLLFAAGFVVFWTLEKYKPINQLAHTVREHIDTTAEMPGFDEQKLLSMTFLSLLESNENHYREIFFTNLLANQYDEGMIVYAMQESGVFVRYPYYLTMVVHIEGNMADEKTQSMVCKSVKDWCGQNDMLSYVLFQKSLNLIAVFLNYKDDATDFFEEDGIMEDLHVFLEDCDVKSNIGMGMTYLSPSQWAISYREACDAMNCSRLSDDNRFMKYTEIEKINSTEDFLSYQTKMVAACKKGDVAEATKMIQELRTHYNNRKISEIQIKYLCYTLIAAMLEFEEDIGSVEKLKAMMFLLLENKVDFRNLFDEVELLYLLIVNEQAEVNSGKNAKKIEVMDRILEITNSHLRDNMLSLESLAAYCEISPSYLNRLFKQHMDCTPMSYVENARMEFVKQRLRETDASIKTIIEEVGYVDQSNFIRKFKRIEGITPIAYRKQHRE